MLLPVPDSLSLNEEGSDGRVDSPHAFSLKSAFHSGQKRTGQNQTLATEGRGVPPNQARPDGGWIGLVWLGKGYFESA